jgi:hypothetical protein
MAQTGVALKPLGTITCTAAAGRHIAPGAVRVGALNQRQFQLR